MFQVVKGFSHPVEQGWQVRDTKDNSGQYKVIICPVERLGKYQRLVSELYLDSYALGAWYMNTGIPMRNVTYQSEFY